MDGFDWEVDGDRVHIIFSLIRNARWVDEEERDLMVFDYGDYEGIYIGLGDLDIDESEHDRELWNMLLQASDLDPT